MRPFNWVLSLLLLMVLATFAVAHPHAGFRLFTGPVHHPVASRAIFAMASAPVMYGYQQQSLALQAPVQVQDPAFQYQQSFQQSFRQQSLSVQAPTFTPAPVQNNVTVFRSGLFGHRLTVIDGLGNVHRIR